MDSINEIKTDHVINALLSKGLVLLKKTDLEELLNIVNLRNRVDKRKTYISHKQVIEMYGVTDYWLKNQREEPNTELVCIPGKNRNSSWKYQVQSIENELERISV